MSRHQGRRAPRIVDPKGDYKGSTRTREVKGPPDAAKVWQTEHWSGRVDAKVAPAPIKVKITPQTMGGE